jgi:hypothetical protein
MTDAQERICFVIAPIGDDDSDARKHSNQVLKYIIAPAVEPLGYRPLRADQISKPGLIGQDIIQHLADDPLVVADLTGHNANVFYELAIRHVARTPIVLLIHRGERVPFDVSHARTIFFDLRDPDSVKAASESVARQVSEMAADSSMIDTPIS